MKKQPTPIEKPKKSSAPGGRFSETKKDAVARSSEQAETKRRPAEWTEVMRSAAQPPKKSPGTPTRQYEIAVSKFAFVKLREW
jgi:hypothetical protein